MTSQVVVIAHDIRSSHNVGALLRTAEGLGVQKVYFTGYTPYPAAVQDERLPHIARKVSNAIHKTALGAEDLITWEHAGDVQSLLSQLGQAGYTICGLEQHDNAIPLPDFVPPAKVALLLGSEIEGIAPDLLATCDHILEIPMAGQKESFNVVQAAAMALYYITFPAHK